MLLRTSLLDEERGGTEVWVPLLLRTFKEHNAAPEHHTEPSSNLSLNSVLSSPKRLCLMINPEPYPNINLKLVLMKILY